MNAILAKKPELPGNLGDCYTEIVKETNRANRAEAKVRELDFELFHTRLKLSHAEQTIRDLKQRKKLTPFAASRGPRP